MRASLSEPLPDPLAVGAGNCVLVRGTLAGDGEQLRGISLTLGAQPPQPAEFVPAAAPGSSEWWLPLVVEPAAGLGRAELRLTVETDRGATELTVGTLELVRDVPAPTLPVPVPDLDPLRPTVAICMATYEPDRDRLAAQLDSIRAQTYERWVCVISDDGSSPAGVALIEELTRDDGRFVLAPAGRNRGFYANFERALAMAPAGAELVQLADQDDVWRAGRLERMVAALAAHPGAILAYSDMRVLDGAGSVISETFWYASDNACEDIGTLAIVNTIFGVASLFRRELLDRALPLPPAFSDQHYHDHWIALCARASGEIVFVDEPTYDYVRHGESVTMAGNEAWAPPPDSALASARILASRISRRLRTALGGAELWRAAYLDRYLMLRQFIAVLELRLGGSLSPSQRRSLRLLDSASGSPRGFLWLVARTLRPLLGRRETMGRERVLVGAIVWRRIAGRRRRAVSR